MKKLFAILIVSFSGFGLMFLAIIIGTIMGALSGWVVGLFFDETILGILGQIGISGFKMWQIGAFLGFVGGFFVRNDLSEKKYH